MRIFLSLLLLTVAFPVSVYSQPEVAVYAQLSDTTNQNPGVTTPVLVSMNTIDEISGMDYSTITNKVTITNSGVYFILAAGQVGKTTGGALKFLDLWLRKNDTDIARSGVRNSISAVDDTKVIVQNMGIRLVAGDTISVYMSVSDSSVGLGLKGFEPVGEPVIPSIIFTILKIGN